MAGDRFAPWRGASSVHFAAFVQARLASWSQDHPLGDMHRLAWLLAILVLGPALAAGEAAPAVLNQRLEVHWLADGARCWYRQQTAPGQHAFILVDAVARTCEPAFDHAL